MSTHTFIYGNYREVSMNNEKAKHGGKRDNAGSKTVDSEKREYRYFLTHTEKEIIDGHRQAKGLDK